MVHMRPQVQEEAVLLVGQWKAAKQSAPLAPQSPDALVGAGSLAPHAAGKSLQSAVLRSRLPPVCRAP